MPADRSEESDESMSRPRVGQPMLIAGLVLALGAAGVLVFSDDQRWLRLAIVAALWAALVGAFLAARYRGNLADRDQRTSDLQAIYELELEREVAARREYELTVESEIRNEVEQRSRQDLVALRNEVQNLRSTLETLIGGEVLVERYAVHAESTRMRPQLRQAPLKRLAAASGAPRGEADTEVFANVRDLRPVTAPIPAQFQTRPPLPRRGDRTERPAWPTPVEPTRIVKPATTRVPDPPAEKPSRVAETPPRVAENPGRIAEPPARAPEPPRVPEPLPPPRKPESPRVADAQRPSAPPAGDSPRTTSSLRALWDEGPITPTHPAELSDRWFMPDAFTDDPPPIAADPLQADWTPSWQREEQIVEPEPPRTPGRHGGTESAVAGRRRADEPDPYGRRVDEPEPPRRQAEHPELYGRQVEQPESYGRQVEEPESYGRRAGEREPHGRVEGLEPPRRAEEREPSRRRAEQSEPYGRRAEEPASYDRRAEPEPYGRRAQASESSARRGAEREPYGRADGFESPGRRAGEPEPSGRRAKQSEPESYGHRAAEPEPYSRTEGLEPPRRRAEEPGPARRHAAEPEPRPAAGRRRRAEDSGTWQAAGQPEPRHSGSHARPEAEPQPRAGSHAAGQSVADLLAQHGNDNQRRRRRRED